MAGSAGFNLYLMIGSTDISGYLDSVSGLPGDVEHGDVSVAGHTQRQYWAGLGKATISVAGPISGTLLGARTTSFWRIAKLRHLAAATAFIHGPKGSTSTYPKYSGNCRFESMTIVSDATKPVMFTAQLAVDNGVTIGTFT